MQEGAGSSRVWTEFGRVWTEFDRVWTEFAAVRSEIRADGESTRRHMDMVAEQFKDYGRLLADGTARNTERLEDHETRIARIETNGP